LPLIAPMYGGGALLIREISCRTGRGWPAVFLLGAAYGVIEGGLVDQSLFNLNFRGVPSFPEMVIPLLGIDAYNTQAFVTGHAVWSIAVPIALTGMLWPDSRNTPCLGNVGLAVCAALYAAGCWVVFRMIYETEPFIAGPRQRLGALAAALALIVAAFLTGKRPRSSEPGRAASAASAAGPASSVPVPESVAAADPDAVTDPDTAAGSSQRRVPRPWVLGIGSFAAAGLFMLRSESWSGVVFGFALIVLAAALVLQWSRRPGWNIRHEFALTAGAVLTYAWLGFVLTMILRPDDGWAWLGNGLFALMAVGLLLLVRMRIRHAK